MRPWSWSLLARLTAGMLTGAGLALAVGLCALAGGCGGKEGEGGGEGNGAGDREAVNVPTVRFTDVTRRAGIKFTHVNGAFGKKLMPETMGSGVAFLDYDRDGKPDLLFATSCYWPGHADKGQPAPTL